MFSKLFSKQTKKSTEIFKGPEKLAETWVGNQELYATLRQESVELAVEYVEKNESSKAEDLYQFLAEKRRYIAIKLNQMDPYYAIGLMRKPNSNNPAFTRLHPQGIYKHYLSELTSRFEKYLQNLQKSDNHFIDASQYSDEVHSSLPHKLVCEGITIKEDNIRLSTIRRTIGTNDGLSILHTPDSELLKIFEKINPLYKEVCSTNKPSNEVLHNLAILAWYLSHAMPCERGSAAITEMFVFTLLIKSGFQLVAYQNSIPLDLEAIFQPDKEKFAQDFPKWFPGLEKSLRLSNSKLSF